MKKFLKKAEGFTLVELIVVIAILGVLAAVAVPAYSGYLEKANASADTQITAAVKTAADAALATKGVVTEITVVTGDAGYVTANVGSDVYDLTGTAPAAITGQKDDANIQADYAVFMGGNTVVFKQKVGTGNDKVVADKAVWTAATGSADAKWTFSKNG